MLAVSAASGLGETEELLDMGARRLLFPFGTWSSSLDSVRTVNEGNIAYRELTLARFFAIFAMNERSTS